MTLDSAKRALVVIDVQNDYVDGSVRIEYPDVNESLVNVGRAIDAAAAAGIPVVVVTTVLPESAPMMARGTRGAELCDVVALRRADHEIEKPMPDSFAGTDLAQWLTDRGVGTICVVGYMTHNCVASTVLSAAHRGFSVELLSDATGSLPYSNRAGSVSAQEIHTAFTAVMQARFANVMTTAEWISGVRTGIFPPRETIYGSYTAARSSGIS